MLYKLACLAGLFGMGLSHMRLVDPSPRSSNTGMTSGPCGSDTYDNADDWPDDDGEYTVLTPGEMYTFIMYPEAAHDGNNYRIALSNEEDDTYDCILIDHIPQISGSASELHVNLMVPDVDCQKCAIQVYMTGATDEDECCDKDNDECGTAYYSCGNVRINGDSNRNNLECEAPCPWDYRDESPGEYVQSTNQNQWMQDPDDSTIYMLNMNVSWQTPHCNDNSMSMCENGNGNGNGGSGGGGRNGNNSQYDESGEMSGEGVFGIIIVLILLIAAGVTFYLKVYRNSDVAKNGGAASSGNNYKEPIAMEVQQSNNTQAVVAVDEDGDGVPTQAAHAKPPPPPPRPAFA